MPNALSKVGPQVGHSVFQFSRRFTTYSKQGSIMSKRIFTRSTLIMAALLTLSACGGKSASPAPTPAAGVATQAPAVAQGAATTQPATGTQSADMDTDGDGIPDAAEIVLGTDANNPDTDGDGQNDLADSRPTFADNPIQENSTTVGFTVDSIVVENNVDAQGAVVSDHLELKLANSTQQDIGNFDIYYTFTDSVTGDAQSYYRPLPDLMLKAGESISLHLDNSGQAGHFSWNPNSLFFTNQNVMKAEATVHAQGYAPQTASVDKDAVGTEGGGD
jgi:hypothetical protein